MNARCPSAASPSISGSNPDAHTRNSAGPAVLIAISSTKATTADLATISTGSRRMVATIATSRSRLGEEAITSTTRR
ncbi:MULTISPECIES: hypothetical protein [Streptomyces]|uniref:hypothetical protein n=1 Tax=Streptomyces TaxID=1883 RepID=UPI001FADCF92|nr:MULTISPECIES: hypothetical protein [Streptomyces]